MHWIKKNGIVISVVLVVVILILILPIKITNTINVQANIIPAREWILQKADDGSIQIIDKDHRKNIVHTVSAYQVVRGDFIEFHMNEKLADKDIIEKNELIGRIESIETERQLAGLKKELGEAKSYLLVSQTGEKETVVKMAEEVVNKMRIQLENQNKIVERKRRLFENNIISEEEYEIEKNMADLYKYELLEAKANLADLQTGAKPEEIALYKKLVTTTKMEIQRINQLMDKFTLRSPMDGWIYRVFSNDTLLIIGDTMSVSIMPVMSSDINKISIGQNFRINADINETGTKPTGKIIHINKTTNYMNKKATILITGLINEPLQKVAAHSILPCSIETEPIVVRDYIINFIKIIFK